jgi:hypothetical protein
VALVDCPDCGTKVSDRAGACPKCGHPVVPLPAPGLPIRERFTAGQVERASWSVRPAFWIGLLVFLLLVSIVSCVGGWNVADRRKDELRAVRQESDEIRADRDRLQGVIAAKQREEREHAPARGEGRRSGRLMLVRQGATYACGGLFDTCVRVLCAVENTTDEPATARVTATYSPNGRQSIVKAETHPVRARDEGVVYIDFPEAESGEAYTYQCVLEDLTVEKR